MLPEAVVGLLEAEAVLEEQAEERRGAEAHSRVASQVASQVEEVPPVVGEGQAEVASCYSGYPQHAAYRRRFQVSDGKWSGVIQKFSGVHL